MSNPYEPGGYGQPGGGGYGEPGGYGGPGGYPEPGGYPGPGAPRPRSGAVTAVGIVNILFGALGLTCGVLIIAFGGAMADMIKSAIAQQPNVDAKDAAMMEGMMGTIIMAIAITIIIFSVPYIIAGLGVLQRKPWGRILTIVLAILAGIVAVLNLLTLSPLALLYGGYCVFALVILFNKQYAAEFR